MAKQGRKSTLQEVHGECLQRKAQQFDEYVSVKSLMLDPSQPGMLIVRRPNSAQEHTYLVDSRVYQQATTVVSGMPGSYIAKLAIGDNANPVLAADNFNYWVGQSKEREVLLRFRHDDEGNAYVRAMLPATWNRIPYEESLNTLMRKFGPEHEVNVARFDDTGLALDFITKELDYETNPNIHVRRDDPVQWGMRFSDSDVGKGPLAISPYTRRLVCTNGAVMLVQGAVINISHTNKSSKVLDEVMCSVRQGIEMVDGYSQHIAEQITTAQGIMLECGGEFNHPERAFGRIGRDELVSKLEDKYVREAWETEGEFLTEPSVWRLHNAYTRAGTHGEELTIDQQLHLQAVGGRVLQLAVSNYHWN